MERMENLQINISQSLFKNAYNDTKKEEGCKLKIKKPSLYWSKPG